MPITSLDEPVAAPPALSDAKRRLLAHRLNNPRAASTSRSTIPPRTQGTSSVNIPITPQQYSIWLDCKLQPHLPTYNEAVTLSFNHDVNLAALELALNAFITRHEVWRTTFSVTGGEVFQQVHPGITVRLPLTDLSPLSEIERESESLRLARSQALAPIDLEFPPLFRAILVRIAPGDTRLHLVLHHLIFDGFSLRHTFLPELESLYTFFASQTGRILPASSLQYADFAVWQARQLESPAANRHLVFLQNQLAGPLPPSQLPLDRPRAAAISHRGDVVRFTLSKDLTVSLNETARTHGVTFYMALVATLKALLFRYSGQPGITLGTVADGRRLPELESMMGYILNVFAVRTAPSSVTPFSAYLTEVKHALLEAHEASDVPFERVVSTLHPHSQDKNTRRDLSHTPIFQTLFAFQPTASTASSWQIANTEISLGISKFDLYIEADEQPAHTKVRIFYSTDLFDAATIDRMAGHWTTLIDAAATSPETPIGDLPLLTPAEQETMLVRWNDSATSLPSQTMHGLFEAQALRSPESPAVSFEDTTLTYDQLARQSTALAHHLQRAGAIPGTLVAVLLDRSPHLVAALLAVLKTGAAYMPLDPGTPSPRIALCLEDGAPSVILTSRARVASLPPVSANILILEDLLDQTSLNSARTPFPSIPEAQDPEALAYVIHTSGSTGRPKGVELSHRGVVNFLLSMQRQPGFTASDIVVALTTVSFDIAVLELFLPLISGGQVVIASRETALDPERLAALIETSHATVLQATPATWSALVSAGWRPTRPIKALCGGEALNRTLADRLLALNLDLWNVYGPTETTIWSTLHHVQPGIGRIPIGRPIDNTFTCILDAHRQPVPINIPGELYIGGAGLARGYRNQPVLTSDKFVYSPPGNGLIPAGTRLYRTGDSALYRAGGVIEVLGRADNQIKIRGYRIELEDVEVNLAAHPRVAFAAAKAWPEPDGGHLLCAYLIGVGGAPPPASEMRAFLRTRVPDYMIPSEIVALASLPLTANGKIDRGQLPRPQRTSVVPDLVSASAFTATELRLARLWAQLLQVNPNSTADSFFDLGGHSLLLLKLIRLIHDEFGVSVPMTSLFQAPSLGALASLITALGAPSAAQTQPVLSSAPIVRLNTGGSRRPLFLIHSLLLYGRLPSALGEDQPFYGLDTLPFDSSSGETWVETMLEDHVRQIKRIQPTGPYQIAGWCFAGLMAYEVARRLEQGGDRVSMLALLDSWNPCSPAAFLVHPTHSDRPTAAQTSTGASAWSFCESAVWKVQFHMRRLSPLEPRERLLYIRQLAGEQLKSIYNPLGRRAKSKLYRTCNRLGLRLPGFLNDPWVITYEWLHHYRVQPYAGNITLFRPAAIPVPPTSDPTCGWRSFTAGRIASVSIPGDRSTMFLMPNIGILAEEVRILIDQQTTTSGHSTAVCHLVLTDPESCVVQVDSPALSC